MSSQKNKILISLGLSAISLSLLSYYIFKQKRQSQIKQSLNNKNNKHKVKPNEVQRIISQQLQQLSSIQQILLQKSSQFDIKYLPYPNQQILTAQCVFQFLRETNQLFEAIQINQIYDKSRQGRRKLFRPLNNENQFKQFKLCSGQYFRFACTLDEEIKYLIQKVQKDFVIFLNIEYHVITQSIQHHIQNQIFRQNLANWTTQVRQIIKNHLTLYNNPLQMKKIEEVMQYQLQLLRKQQIVNRLIEIVYGLGIQSQEQLQCLPTLFGCLLEDSVYTKFGVELQQLNCGQLQADLQVYNMIQEYNDMQKIIMQKLYDKARQKLIENDQQNI